MKIRMATTITTEKSLSTTVTEITKSFYDLYSHAYKVSSTKVGFSGSRLRYDWYEFENHRWNLTGSSMIKLSFKKRLTLMASLNLEIREDHMLDHIIKEYAILFHDSDFGMRVDTDMKLIHFTNGEYSPITPWAT